MSTDGHELSHIQQLKAHSDSDTSIESHDSDESFPSEESRPPVQISNGYPPIPFRFMKRVEERLFVEMAELLPSYLDSADLNNDDQRSRSCKRPPDSVGYS